MNHSHEILEMSKSLSFSSEIPSFVQENIKKLFGFIQVARQFYLESKRRDSDLEKADEEEKAREEFFAQFRKSEPAFKPTELSENPRNLEISPQRKSIQLANKPSNQSLNTSPSNSLATKVNSTN